MIGTNTLLPLPGKKKVPSPSRAASQKGAEKGVFPEIPLHPAPLPTYLILKEKYPLSKMKSYDFQFSHLEDSLSPEIPCSIFNL
jgi:hypothetical protein